MNDRDDDTVGTLGEKYRSFVLLNEKIRDASGTLESDNELVQSKILSLKSEREKTWNELLGMALSDENSSM